MVSRGSSGYGVRDMRSPSVLLLALALAGCAASEGVQDGGGGDAAALRDAEARDAGAVDARGEDGAVDGGGEDAALRDAGAQDAGLQDATPPQDASLPDAEPLDAEPGDAAAPDASPADAGTPDGGLVLQYPAQRVGIFYLTWHAYASNALRQRPPAERRTVERILQTPPSSFADILEQAGLSQAAAGFHYHVEPAPGFYCFYRARPGDPAPPLPDCPDISTVAATHAQQLWSAGVDFVYVDLTNIPVFGEFADVLGVRPLEVLFEEWAALRAQGVATPQIAAWVPAPDVAAPDTPTYARVLQLYQRPEYTDLVLRHQGQPVLFVVDHGGLPPSATQLATISAAGVLPVRLWGNLGASALAAGTAGWMQPCTTAAGDFTTLVEGGQPCRQGYTTTSPLGTVLSASLSYQVGYASLPYQASGKLGGLTFQKQMETALAVQPDYLLLNAWNEHIAQPQPNPNPASLGALRRSMGIAASDASADWLWVDMYGHGLSRDFEPSVEGGTAAYDLMQSCLRVWRTGANTCADVNEACCQRAPDMILVRSVRGRDAANALDTHHVLTAQVGERDALLATGAWEEVCNPFYGPPGLCGGATTADGPFHLFAAPGPDRVALYRCYTGVANFFSPDPGCEGTQVVGLLGYLSTRRDSVTPRPLRRCYRSDAQVHLHWLGEHCPAGLNEEAILGFVR
jgi:hypothetical protein